MATQLFKDFSKLFDSIHWENMEQIQLAYGLFKETAITMMYKNIKAIVRSPAGDTNFFDIVAGVFRRDILAPYIFI